MKKLIALFVLFGIFIVVGITYYTFLPDRKILTPPAKDYEDCVAQGGTVAESYPSVCTTPDGKRFTQNIGNEIEKNNLIRLETPRPGQKIKSPLLIRGEARGSWFFEATFPVKLLDSKGQEIAVGYAEAEGEWMTMEFVPFTANIEFRTDDTRGLLILEKSNPSGLTHNEDQLSIPVSF